MYAVFVWGAWIILAIYNSNNTHHQWLCVCEQQCNDDIHMPLEFENFFSKLIETTIKIAYGNPNAICFIESIARHTHTHIYVTYNKAHEKFSGKKNLLHTISLYIPGTECISQNKSQYCGTAKKEA